MGRHNKESTRKQQASNRSSYEKGQNCDHDQDSLSHDDEGYDHNHDHSHDHSHDHDHGHSHSHGHGHSHSHGHGHHHHGPNNKKGLLIAFVITTGIMVLEFVGGLLTKSLALLSDSGHMLSDAGALLLSLVAMSFAAKKASTSKSFGYQRFEILAALLNGVTLFVIAAFIVAEAVKRFASPPEVASGSMMLIACIGLLANIMSAWFLMRQGDVKDNVNVRSAYLHVIGDALGSVGAIIAGALMYAFSWYIADPIISIVVALLILKSAWGIIQSTLHILMQGTPSGIKPKAVTAMLLQIEGVKDVHDLHIWTITSGMNSFSCHLIVEEEVDCQAVLQRSLRQLEERYQLKHVTIQIEKPGLEHPELHQ